MTAHASNCTRIMHYACVNCVLFTCTVVGVARLVVTSSWIVLCKVHSVIVLQQADASLQ